MTWPARTLLAITLPLCLLAGTGAGAAAAPLPPQLIQLRDLRPGYVQTVSRIFAANAATARAHIAWRLLLDQGWQGGYQALFRRRENAGIQVGEIADQFKTARGASWWYGVSLVMVPVSYHAINLAPVGDESTGVQNKDWVGLIFRRGAWVVDVYVSSQVPDPPLSALARLVDRRLQA